ncbi:MAG: PilN domain-containing protein [Limnospira sp.]
MYSLDINFLNDRPEYKPREKKAIAPTSGGQPIDQKPILIGVGAAIALNALVGGIWFVFNQRNTQLQKEVEALQAQLGEKTSQVNELEQIYTETKQTNEEADALATVFNEIKPWSALSQEMAELMQIAGIRIANIEQTEPEPAAAPAAAKEGEEAPPPPPRNTATVKIEGFASSFGQLNDFILLLNQSPFFDGEKTKLLAAELRDNPAQLVVDGDDRRADLELQPVVEYEIETALSSAKASELLPLLKSNDAVGLVNRIETLQEKGVIQP